MLQNKQSHRHSLCNVMSHVVLFAYSINLNMLTKSTVTKILQKKIYCEFKLSFQCNRENTLGTLREQGKTTDLET